MWTEWISSHRACLKVIKHRAATWKFSALWPVGRALRNSLYSHAQTFFYTQILIWQDELQDDLQCTWSVNKFQGSTHAVLQWNGPGPLAPKPKITVVVLVCTIRNFSTVKWYKFCLWTPLPHPRYGEGQRPDGQTPKFSDLKSQCWNYSTCCWSVCEDGPWG